jgi:L-rhamnose isomerase
MQERELTSSFRSAMTEAKVGVEQEVPATMPGWLPAQILLVPPDMAAPRKRRTEHDSKVLALRGDVGEATAAAVKSATLGDGAEAVEEREVGCDVFSLVVGDGEVVREA